MKVLYLSYQLPRDNTFVDQDVNLIAEENEVLYITFNKDQEVNKAQSVTTKKYNCEVIPYPFHSLKSKFLWRLEKSDLYLDRYSRVFSNRLSSAISAFNPDIIHCQFLYESLVYFDNVKDFNTPVIVNFRGYGASSKLQFKKYVDKIRAIVAQKNVHCISVCNALVQRLKKENIEFANKPHILYTGIDLKTFVRTDYQEKDPFFVQVAAFIGKKGQLISVKAFNKFIENTGNQTAKMLLIGIGKEKEKVRRYTIDNGLEDRIQFWGYGGQENVLKALQRATTYIHHSIVPKNGDMEGVPNAIIEAMAMELPVLSTYHSGIPEAVENNVNGFLCQENDIDAYARNFEKALNIGYLPNNRKKVCEKFNIKNHIIQLKSIYTLICDLPLQK